MNRPLALPGFTLTFPEHYEKPTPPTRTVAGGVFPRGARRRRADVPVPDAERNELPFHRNERRDPACRRRWRGDDRRWGNPGHVDYTEPASRRDRGRRPAHSGVDLSAFFTNDIDDGLRQTLWDIGADDLAVTTAVELVAFIAVRDGDRVVVEWETASELDSLGFHLYRSTSAEGPFERLTAQPVPGLGTSSVGASYRYVDEGVATAKTYYYELEDLETTGGTERHGPIAVTLGDASDESEEQARTQIAYGTPEENALRVVKRTANYVVIELKTSGFFAEPLDDGSVRLSVPGFDEADGLPVNRAWVDSTEGRDIVLKRVWTRDVRTFSSLRPGATVAELVATADGGVQLRQRERKRIEASTTHAELVDVAIQGEQKKALVELSPFYWNGNELSVATRLYVRLAFKKPARRAKTRRVKQVWRLTTPEAGLYAYPLRTHSRQLRLSRHGKDVPFHVEGRMLFFVGEGGGAIYELEAGVQGAVMSVVNTSAAGPPTEVAWHTERREESFLYQAGLIARDDPWLWDALFAPATRKRACWTTSSGSLGTAVPFERPSLSVVNFLLGALV